MLSATGRTTLPVHIFCPPPVNCADGIVMEFFACYCYITWENAQGPVLSCHTNVLSNTTIFLCEEIIFHSYSDWFYTLKRNSSAQCIFSFRWALRCPGWGRTFGVSRTGQKGQRKFPKRAISGTKQAIPFQKAFLTPKQGSKGAKGLSGPTLDVFIQLDYWLRWLYTAEWAESVAGKTYFP